MGQCNNLYTIHFPLYYEFNWNVDDDLVLDEACGPYGHDIHLREVCAAWKRPPVTEMSREEYDAW